MRAIISVFNKEGLTGFVRGLVDLGVTVYSTGGTQKALEADGIPVIGVAELTGFPEMMDGRVKTLHPKIHGGILAIRSNADHMSELRDSGIEPIDMVVGNLYPFVETVRRDGVTLEEVLENIDIGGPTMIRASAKNFPSVLTVVDPEDYDWLLDQLRLGLVSLDDRRTLAWKAFEHVAHYDAAVASYLREERDPLSEKLTIGLQRVQPLRYGENPHQKAAFYSEVFGGVGTIASADQLHGPELSHNNILDADAAWTAVCDFDDPTVAIIKHTNPCGLASRDDITAAYVNALAGDPLSAFGGIVAFNRMLTATTADEVAKTHYDILIAPGFDAGALAKLKRKKNLRILKIPLGGALASALDYRRVSGGFLVQNRDLIEEDPSLWEVVTHRRPTPEELAEMSFAWKLVKHVKSNAIVLTTGRALVGMGAGQPNRVTSVHLALRNAQERAVGTVLASDAFFPFPDGLELAAKGGVTAVVQPGGSIRDADVVLEADRHGLAMLFTGTRHFRH